MTQTHDFRILHFCCLACVIILFHVTGFAQKPCDCPRGPELRKEIDLQDTITSFMGKRLFLGELGKKNGEPGCQSMIFNAIGMTYIKEHKFDSAAIALAYQKGILDGLSCPDSTYLSYLGCMTPLYGLQMKNDTAMLYATAFLHVARSAHNEPAEMFALSTLASIHSGENNIEMSMHYTRRWLKMGEKYPNPLYRYNQMQTGHALYMRFYQQDSSNKGALDTARTLAVEALALARLMKWRQYYPNAFTNMAEVEFSSGNARPGLSYLDSATVYLVPGDQPSQHFSIYSRRSEYYASINDHANALATLERGLPYMPRNNVGLERSVWQSIYRHAKATGDQGKALAALEKSDQLEDSIFTVEKTRSLQEFEAKFNKADQDRRIAELNQDQTVKDLRIRSLNFTIATAVLVAVILLVASFVLYRSRLARSRRTQLEAELRLNRARINPHVFFNVLTSLQAMALDPAHAPSVPDYLARYARLMRMTLESTYTELISLEQELHNLEDYLAIQSMHYPGRFTHQVVLEPGVDPDEVQVPSLLLQPLCENAIEHGFRGRPTGGELRIEVRKVDGGYLAVVDDNGEPDGAAVSAHAGFPGRASQIIEDRLLLLNARLRRGVAFVLRKGAKPQGYRVEILIPELLATGEGANLS